MGIRYKQTEPLGEENHLIAVTASANRSKGAKGPEEWEPPEQSYWCQYAQDWAEIKEWWELTMTKVESEIVTDMLGTCENPPDVELWEALGTATGEHKPEPTAEPGSSSTDHARKRSPWGNRECREGGAEAAGVSRRRWSRPRGTGTGRGWCVRRRDPLRNKMLCSFGTNSTLDTQRPNRQNLPPRPKPRWDVH